MKLVFLDSHTTFFATLFICFVYALPPSQPSSLSISIPIKSLFNNKAFGSGGDFDHVGTTFVPTKETSNLLLVDFESSESDNIEVDHSGKHIPLETSEPLGALYILASTTHGPLTVEASIAYEDETQDTTMLSLPDWQDSYVHHMDRYQAFQYVLSNNQEGYLYKIPIYTNPIKVPRQLSFSHSNINAALHIFSVTAYPVQGVLVTDVMATHEWRNNHDQVVLIRLHNTGASWVHNASVHVTSDQVKTVEKGHASIAPGHAYLTQVVVRGHTDETVSVAVAGEKSQHRVRLDSELVYTTKTLDKHRAPTWLKNSKFGIFVHWGLYSVPAWAPVGKSYAEWYWWNMNSEPTLSYHRDTYGANFTYDDFLTLWKPTEFNVSSWLRLIDQSRARYFVFTAKHHDGISLFNTSVTNRSSMRLLFPNRDFVGELIRESKKEFPHLKRGIYFSMPEWYHPKYNDDSLGWHGPPISPYTKERIAYLGSSEVDDFVNELQVPQIQELIHQYSPDILWCDIGGINNSSVWQKEYFNNALREGRQVAVNDRCGDGSISDFTTIEYKAVKDTPARFWEATRGMDPYSFGYNKQTRPEEYASTKELLLNLIESACRGGNFLLDIGPEASGKIIDTIAQRLKEIGYWLDSVEASIFDSVPYWINAEEDDLRFTAHQDGSSVYVFLTSIKKQSIEIKTPLPVTKDTKIRLMNDNNRLIKWRVRQNTLVINIENIDNILIPVFEIKFY